MDEILDNGILDDLKENAVEYAGFWPRVGATLVDSLVLSPLIGLGFYNAFYLKSIPILVAGSLLSALYKPYLEWKKSATLGKMALGIKLVDKSMNNITMEQALKRYVPWMISAVIGLVYNISIYLKPGFEEITTFLDFGTFSQDSSMTALNSGYSMIFLLVIGTFAFDRKKQGLHDQYAKTFCIKVKKED